MAEVNPSDIATPKQETFLEVLAKDREYLILEGLIKALEEGKYYDKGDLAKVLRNYQLWVWDILTTALTIAERADINAYIHENRFEEMKQYYKKK